MHEKNRRILYMEDDPALARLVRGQLERLGYVVEVACNGREGLAKCAAGGYDLVIVDQTMPGYDGLDVIRLLAARGPLPPTIMVTGSANESVAVEAMKLGISDYLVKDMAGGFLRFLPAAIGRAIQHRQLAEERRRAEEEVRSLKQQIGFLLAATKTGLGIIGSDFTIRYVDPRCRKTYGDPTGKTCYEYFMGRSRPCEKCGAAKALATKQIAVTEMVLPKECNRPTQVISIPFQNEQGEWLAAEVNVDITERKQMERELIQAHKMEAIGQLAAGIAHEINTPTQYITDNTRFLQQGFDDLDGLLGAFGRLLEAAKENRVTDRLIAEVETRIRRADFDYLTGEIPKAIRQSLEGLDCVTTIVRAIKEFSHPGRKYKQAVDLNHIIKNTLTVSRNEWKYVAELVTELDPNLPPVPCFCGDLSQVILNLIVNAAQAVANVAPESVGEKGLITVRTRRDGDWAEIRVEDAGAGIPEEARSRVFDPFFTTKEVGKGTGQGLAIARFIVVQKHGGMIDFETQAGRGTTFIIRLPLVDQSEARQDTQPQNTDLAG